MKISKYKQEQFISCLKLHDFMVPLAVFYYFFAAHLTVSSSGIILM